MKWLFLVHQVQTPNSRERVRVWRLTKKVGALLYRNSVYVLPYGKDRLEDFQWLCQQIRDSKGEASVFVSEAKDAAEDRQLRQQFMTARGREYLDLEKRAGGFADQFGRSEGQSPFTPAQLRTIERELGQLEDTYREIKRVDFFEHPLSGKLERTLKQLRITLPGSEPSKAAVPSTLKHHSRSEFRGKVWATRPHIHIDRVCSAWLIKRFIDAKARFVFAPEEKLPKNAVPFDVFGVEFSHQGDRCTFETLLESFRIRDRALSSMAELVHEIDLKDRKFNRPESAGLDMVIRSISDSTGDDDRTLELGSHILDGMYKRLSRDESR